MVERRSFSGFYYDLPKIHQLVKYCHTEYNFNRECKISIIYNYLYSPTCVAAVLNEKRFNSPELFFSFVEGSFKGKLCHLYPYRQTIFWWPEELIIHGLYGSHLIMGCDYCRMKVPCDCPISNGDHMIMTNSDVCKESFKKIICVWKI